MSRGKLIELLQVTIDMLTARDSVEGRIVYTLVGPDEFSVNAFVREGNSQGQGGAIIIEDEEESA